MDYAKLAHVNGVYLRAADDERLAADVLSRLAGRDGLVLDDTARARIRALMPGLKDRAKSLADLADNAAFLARPLPLDYEPRARALIDGGAELLRGLAATLAAVEPFTEIGRAHV